MVEWNNLLEGKLSGKLIPDDFAYKRKTADNESLSAVSVIRLVSELSLFYWRNIKRYLFIIRVFRYSVVAFYLSE